MNVSQKDIEKLDFERVKHMKLTWPDLRQTMKSYKTGFSRHRLLKVDIHSDVLEQNF